MYGAVIMYAKILLQNRWLKVFPVGNDRALYADLRIIQDLSVLTSGLSAELAIAYDNRASYWDNKTKELSV